MSDDPYQTLIIKKASGLSLLVKILLMVVYRTALLASAFVIGHFAYMVHWSLALVVSAAAFAAILRFWSPSNVLDGNQM
mgnify:CR=1 FL=1